MNTDRPDGPPHDDALLAEFAALDELLRKPEEPARPPAPPAELKVTEPFEPAPPSQNGVAAAREGVPHSRNDAPSREAVAPSRDVIASARDGVPPSGRRMAPSRDGVMTSRNRVPFSGRRMPVSRGRVERLRDRVASLLARAEPSQPQDLAVPSRERGVETLRVTPVRSPSQRRRIRVAALWLGALTVGLLAGGLLGWWHATHPVVATPPASTVETRPATAPATPARGASRPTRPAKTMPLAAPTAPTASAPTAALSKAAPAASASNAGAPDVALPPPAPVEKPDTIVEAIPVTPAPSLDLPLTTAPLPAPPLPPAVAAAGGLAAAMVAADEAAIETTLRRYEEAYENLDAKAAAAVWPTVDRRALSHAFEGLASQRLNFRGCEVLVRAGARTATASCNGTAEYVRKVGDARVRVEPRQWNFTLNKTQGAWRIEAVDGSR